MKKMRWVSQIIRTANKNEGEKEPERNEKDREG